MDKGNLEMGLYLLEEAGKTDQTKLFLRKKKKSENGFAEFKD